MTEKIRDQYDSLYASNEVVFGGGKPIPAVCKLNNYLQTGSVLDIGGGEGRNALFLAQQGFQVTVLDLSEVGLKKIKSAAEENNLKINTRVTDVVAEGIEGAYDSIVMSFMLHHLNEADAKKLIAEAQQHTSDKGVHVLSTFSDQGGLYERNKESGKFYPNENTLKGLYKDWDIKILTTYEITSWARDKEGKRMKNHVVSLIALKGLSH